MSFTQKLKYSSLLLVVIIVISSCRTQKTTVDKGEDDSNKQTELADETSKKDDTKAKTTSPVKTKPKEEYDAKTEAAIESGKSRIYNPDFVMEDSLIMEQVYIKMLEPISTYKKSHPEIYWFIVSWLNTKYGTPNWNNYSTGQWRINTKATGIDCSGFARVFEYEIFDQKINGSSQRLLDKYSNRVKSSELTLGDLVFFRQYDPEAPTRIVHVGVYLYDGYFVHATSTGSASKGKGLNISSLSENHWKIRFETGGKLKSN